MNAEWAWQATAVATTAVSTLAAKTGQIAVDHDQPSQATKLYIHRLDASNTDRSGNLVRLTKHDRVYLQQKTLATSWHRYEVTGRPTFDGELWVVPVRTEVGSPQGTEPGNNVALLVEIP